MVGVECLWDPWGMMVAQELRLMNWHLGSEMPLKDEG